MKRAMLMMLMVGCSAPEGLPGSQGEEGQPGEEGVAGPSGAEGTQGVVGDDGPEGQTGQAGQEGAVGAEGPTGQSGTALPCGYSVGFASPIAGQWATIKTACELACGSAVARPCSEHEVVVALTSGVAMSEGRFVSSLNCLAWTSTSQASGGLTLFQGTLMPNLLACNQSHPFVCCQ